MPYDDWKLQSDRDGYADDDGFYRAVSLRCRQDEHGRCGDPMCDCECHDELDGVRVVRKDEGRNRG